MTIKNIFRVLYEPHKVFKDIIKNPSYLDPLIIFIILVLSLSGLFYMNAPKVFEERTLPIGDLDDEWTANALTWISDPGVTISNNMDDFIHSMFYYDNTSIAFDALDLNLINMEIPDFDTSVNCGPQGFNNVSLRIKINSPANNPISAILILNSLDDSTFVVDITDEIKNNLGDWTNLTLPVGSGDWISSGTAAVWENITGLKLEFSWSTNSQINILIDGLFFRGDYRTMDIPIDIFIISIFFTIPSLFQWLLLAGIMYMLINWLKGEIVWKPLMVAVGYTLILLVVQNIILAVITTYIPNIYYPLEYLAQIPGESEVANQVISNQLSSILSIQTSIVLAINVLTTIFGAFITKAITEFTWKKSYLVSGVSVFLTLIILGFMNF